VTDGPSDGSSADSSGTQPGRSDVRFLLPALPGSASWLGDVAPWPAVPSGPVVPSTRAPSLVVASADRIEDAAATGADFVIVQGPDARRRLTAHGYTAQGFLPLPSLDAPGFLVPLDRPGPARYVLHRAIAPSRRWKRARNHVVAALLARGVAPPRTELLSIGVRQPGPPFLVRAAEALGIPSDVDWLLSPGQGDILSRGVITLFPKGSETPRWALKFTRAPGYRDPFDRDERGLHLAASAGPAASSHTPRLIGRLDSDGYHASVETAAVGHRLIAYLHSSAPRRAKLETVGRVAAWVIEVGSQTAGSPDRLGPERRRVEEEVLPSWRALGATGRLASELPPVPAVLQHNDLGSWNLVVDGPEFTVLDWEDALGHGFPLWDLWYFLLDVLAHLDGAQDLESRERHAVRLFRGELASSRVLFDWTRRAVKALALPPDAIGSLATLCFLHHGLSQGPRTAEVVRRSGTGPDVELSPMTRVAARWLDDAELGPGWRAWQS
jgi:hypothetical protein